MRSDHDRLYTKSFSNMTSRDHAVHFFAGGAGGTVGAVITCPLEVVKTRLQSSVATFVHPAFRNTTSLTALSARGQVVGLSTHAGNVGLAATEAALQNAKCRSLGLYFCLRHIVKAEGIQGLFKGLGPNLVGVAPSRAIYFFSYANAKKTLNRSGYFRPDTPVVHICSAMTAGFTACTATNPIWFIKTRLQLDQKKNDSLTCRQCIRNTLKTHGWIGFYKGITASYVGITETVIHFVIYESIKARLMQYNHHNQLLKEDKLMGDFFRCMLAGAISKSIATCIAYPHEVARTRLREEGSKYKTFVQTILLVYKEDGYHGLYRGLATQLVRQIPNTAIMMATYEAVVYIFSNTKHMDNS